MRQAVLIICLILMVSVLIGCEPPGKVSASDAIKVIQESESTYPGVTTSKAIAGLLQALEARGRFIDVVGWTQEYRSGGTHDVWLKVKVNDDPSEFHWVISSDGTINPANQLAQNVTKVQVIKK